MPIYLDHNASAQPCPIAAQAAAAWLMRASGHPDSVHGGGRGARAAMARARAQLAAALGISAGRLDWCSGATEGLRLVAALSVPSGAHVVTSAVEHPALFAALEARRADVTRIPVDEMGRLAVADVVRAVRPDTALVAVMCAQNELGNLYPIKEICAAVAPVPVLMDAVQAFGKVPVNFAGLGCAYAVLSGHKVGAPQGVGALYRRDAGPELPARGTPNVAGAIGFGVAAQGVPSRLASMARVGGLRDVLQAALLDAVEGLKVHGDPAARLGNTLSLRVDGVSNEVLLAALDLEGIYISAGAACASGGLEPSPVLRALGLSDAEARTGLRISLGPETTDEDIATVCAVFPKLVARARAVETR